MADDHDHKDHTPRVKRQRLSDQVAEALKDQLLAEGLRAGDRLPTEAELVDEFGVSRTVVREATRILAEWGLVDIRAGRGMVVADFDGSALARQYALMVALNPGSFEDLMELRLALETSIARLAAQRRTEVDLKAIEATLDAFASEAVTEDERLRADLQFHAAIAEATHNPFFVQASGPVNEYLQLTYESSQGYERAVADTLREHRAIAAAIAAGDPDAAAHATRAHLHRIRESRDQLVAPRDGAAATESRP